LGGKLFFGCLSFFIAPFFKNNTYTILNPLGFQLDWQNMKLIMNCLGNLFSLHLNNICFICIIIFIKLFFSMKWWLIMGQFSFREIFLRIIHFYKKTFWDSLVGCNVVYMNKLWKSSLLYECAWS
jgi:hypothetical protein